MAENNGNAQGAGDNPLKRIAEYFETVGWDKRLVDLTEDEVVGLIFVSQSRSQSLMIAAASSEGDGRWLWLDGILDDPIK